jgi:hypothetical protein
VQPLSNGRVAQKFRSKNLEFGMHVELGSEFQLPNS